MLASTSFQETGNQTSKAKPNVNLNLNLNLNSFLRCAEDPVLDDLERLADLLEQYFHPSNTGSCAPALSC